MTRESAPPLDGVNARRMRELLLDFASIPSPPHDTAIAAEWYAGCLRASGAAEVQMLRDHPRTPTVIAGFPGLRRGPILEIHGHLDAPQETHRRAHYADGAIAGSGLIAGKAELIAAAEAARILASTGPLPGGGLLIVATSGREPPGGDQCLTTCIDRGVVGDAVVIAGGDDRVAPVGGMGLGIFRASFAARRGRAFPTGATGPGCYTAIDAAQGFVSLLRRRHVQLSRRYDPLLGPESLCVSRIWGGDRFDRPPAGCEVEGHWRWLPERAAGEVADELERLAQQVARLRGVLANLTLTPLRAGYRIDPDHRVVRALRIAHQQMTGRPLPLGTGVFSACAEPFQRLAGITAIAHGVDTATLHGDPEIVTIDELVRVARVYLGTALRYLAQERPAGPKEARPPRPAAEPVPAHDGRPALSTPGAVWPEPALHGEGAR